MLALKIFLSVSVMVAFWMGTDWYLQSIQPETARDLAIKQFDNDDQVTRDMRQYQWWTQAVHVGGLALMGVMSLFFVSDVNAAIRKRRTKAFSRTGLMLFASTSLVAVGCVRPYEPVQLETVETSETAFLLPLTGDTTKQESFKSEELLAKNMVAVKEVSIPHRWVKTGYDIFGDNGKWVPSARLVKVDRAPVTREWTADPNSGTSNKNEAIWVMTSDGIQFSTGWTCTARISTDRDAVKFLFNYPNGSLKTVLDGEVRAKIQAVFGEDVTDRPIREMQQNSTPIFVRVRTEVTKFFQERGITITNLGITGGYVYVDKKIQEAMNEIFKANSQKAIAEAATAAQEEKNKAILLSAKGKAEAEVTEKEGIAKGIKAVADAKAYEIEKAQQNLQAYLALKRLELETTKTEKWDGKFPNWYMGGPSGHGPEILLNVPAFAETVNVGK